MPGKAEEKKPAADSAKGKEKVTEEKPNGAESTKDADDKDGVKAELPPEELSEEDQKLKEELDMLVERLQVRFSNMCRSHIFVSSEVISHFSLH